MTATENQPFEDTPNHELLTKLRSVYKEEGVSIWLAHAIRQGWSMEECLRRADILVSTPKPRTVVPAPSTDPAYEALEKVSTLLAKAYSAAEWGWDVEVIRRALARAEDSAC